MSLLVGLTGGMGSGKSLAAQFFQEQGAFIIDADELCRNIVRIGQPALKEILNIFGDSVLDSDGNLNREVLGEIIFQDTKKKSILESILHPKIFAKEKEEYLRITANSPSAIVILDSPLLIESGNFNSVDKVIVIYSSEEQQVRRILSRSSLDHSKAIARIKTQMSIAEKIKYADFILDNQSDPEELMKKVSKLYKKLLKSL